METDLELGIATMLRDATMQNVVLDLRTPTDWVEFNRIKDTARQDEQNEIETFRENKPELLVKAREELIDKAGSLTHGHPTPFGTDRFDKSTIDRQAMIKVENDHQARLLGIQQRESDDYSDLKDDIHVREQSRGRGREAFSRATDRRGNQDRRMPER